MIKIFIIGAIGLISFIPLKQTGKGFTDNRYAKDSLKKKKQNKGMPTGYFRPKVDITARTLEEMHYAFAVAYSYNTEHPVEMDIIDRKTINLTAKLPGKILTKGETGHVLSVLGNKSSYDQGAMACFEPRMGIVFYDKDTVVKGYVSICFVCNRLTSTPRIQALDDVILKKTGAIGFSKTGKDQLQNMCKKLELGDCEVKKKIEKK